MSEAVELSQDALETIGSYVRKNLPAWMEEVRPQALTARDFELTELKAQRELMRQSFGQGERRLEQLDNAIWETGRDGQPRPNPSIRRMDRQFAVMTTMLGLITAAAYIFFF